jgi:hypothetical protein
VSANGYRVQCTVCGKTRMSGHNPLKNGWPKCCDYTMCLVDAHAFIENINAEVRGCFGTLAVSRRTESARGSRREHR